MLDVGAGGLGLEGDLKTTDGDEWNVERKKNAGFTCGGIRSKIRRFLSSRHQPAVVPSEVVQRIALCYGLRSQNGGFLMLIEGQKE